MARPPQIRPEELTPDTPGRIKLVTWPDYQRELEEEDSRKYVFVTIFRPTDTILYATTEARLLWWELVRLSGAGWNKGWLVIGKNDPITPRQIAGILHLDLKTIVMPGLVENMRAGRIVINSEGQFQVNSEKPQRKEINSEKPSINSEKPPFNESDGATSQRTQDPAPVHKISKEKRREEKRRERARAREAPPPPFSKRSKEEKNAIAVFWLAWQQLYCKTWETLEEYLPTDFERRAVREAITSVTIERHVAYAYYYHQKDVKVGVIPGQQIPVVDKFFKAVAHYCTSLRNGSVEWEQAKSWSREFLEKQGLSRYLIT